MDSARIVSVDGGSDRAACRSPQARPGHRHDRRASGICSAAAVSARQWRSKTLENTDLATGRPGIGVSAYDRG